MTVFWLRRVGVDLSISHLPSVWGEDIYVLSWDQWFIGGEDLFILSLVEGEGVVVGVGVRSFIGPEWPLYGIYWEGKEAILVHRTPVDVDRGDILGWVWGCVSIKRKHG